MFDGAPGEPSASGLTWQICQIKERELDIELDFRTPIINEIVDERTYQENRWGNEADDELNEPNDFIAYMNAYSTRWFPGGFTPYTPETIDAFRTSMIKTAAIAVAAVESVDRQRDEAGHTFYEAGLRTTKQTITSPRGGNDNA
jgi:hypothetical protein